MEKVLEVSERIWQAMKNEEIDLLEKDVHQNAVFVHMGVTLSRDEELDVIKNRKIVYQDIDFQEKTVKLIDSTVVLLNKLKLTAVVNGNEVTNPFVVTEIYTKTGDELKLVSMSYTRIIY